MTETSFSRKNHLQNFLLGNAALVFFSTAHQIKLKTLTSPEVRMPGLFSKSCDSFLFIHTLSITGRTQNAQAVKASNLNQVSTVMLYNLKTSIKETEKRKLLS